MKVWIVTEQSIDYVDMICGFADRAKAVEFVRGLARRDGTPEGNDDGEGEYCTGVHPRVRFWFQVDAVEVET